MFIARGKRAELATRPVCSDGHRHVGSRQTTDGALDSSADSFAISPSPHCTALDTLTSGGIMSSDNPHVHPESEMDLAIERALESAKLQAGGATTTSTAFVEHGELSAAEADGGAADGD
ncbi:hypothetical protein [Microbacterium sp. CFBP9034]|uniref:hypothetical protein n=1 Tax=Microbacterium sp. CFBP9034 TaxID=3096540 RepID=UPI002A6A1FAB|nr:hypothetical protein [Microbacterium sp. CFBP9034]MDY0910801.1 hypothetical protein [Microbacterium sp. CFBP9034]